MTPDIPLLVNTMVKDALAYHTFLSQNAISTGLFAGELETENGTLLKKGKAISYPNTLTGHQKLEAIRLEKQLAKSLTSLNTFVKTIPGIPNIWDITFKGNPGSTPLWALHLESAAVCPSGDAEDQYLYRSLEIQAGQLTKKLSMAWENSQSWTAPLSSYGVCGWTTDGIQFPCRGVDAPSPEQALLADEWLHWITDATTPRAVVDNTNTPLLIG